VAPLRCSPVDRKVQGPAPGGRRRSSAYAARVRVQYCSLKTRQQLVAIPRNSRCAKLKHRNPAFASVDYSVGQRAVAVMTAGGPVNTSATRNVVPFRSLPTEHRNSVYFRSAGIPLEKGRKSFPLKSPRGKCFSSLPLFS
jgi:hypothetical protein